MAIRWRLERQIPAVRYGKPCVRGTRLTVGDVLGSLASSMSEAELLEDFPQLSHDVLACLAYAADRERCLITLSSSAALMIWRSGDLGEGPGPIRSHSGGVSAAGLQPSSLSNPWMS